MIPTETADKHIHDTPKADEKDESADAIERQSLSALFSLVLSRVDDKEFDGVPDEKQQSDAEEKRQQHVADKSRHADDQFLNILHGIIIARGKRQKAALLNKWVDFATMAWPEKVNARLAQLVEHSTDTRKVLGSNPRARTE